MRRKLSALLSFIIVLLILITQPALALTPGDYDAHSPQLLTADMLYADGAVLIDANSGDVLFSKNATTRMHPASTTKIMTLLLAVESGIALDREISIPQAAADVAKDSTLVPVYPGETMTFGDLLLGFMLNSGNDGANAVAVLVSGTLESFVERMNARALELGCQNTHFANAHGYTQEGHYTSPYDMALITRAGLQNETFRSIVSRSSATITVKERGEIFVGNKHLVLVPSSTYYYEGAIGVKTGTTSAAGNCFVGAAERDGATIISVVYKAPEDAQRWDDTIHLFNYAWTCYDAYTIDQMYEIASPQIASFVISNAAPDDPGEGRLNLEIASISNSNYVRMVERSSETALSEAVTDFISRTQVQVTHDLTAPISQGEIIGDFSYFDPTTGNTVTAKLIASRDVKERTVLATLTDYFPFLRIFQNRLFLMLLGILALLIALIIMLVCSRRAAKQRRRHRIYERRRAEYLRNQAMKGETRHLSAKAPSNNRPPRRYTNVNGETRSVPKVRGPRR